MKKKKRTKKGGYEQVAYEVAGEIELRDLEESSGIVDDDVQVNQGGLGVSDFVVSVYCVTGVVGLGRQLAVTLVPVFAVQSLGLNSRQIGIATACVGLGRILGNGPGACLGKSIGDRATAAVGLSVLVVAGAGLAVVTSWIGLCVAQAGLGLHSSVFELGRQSYLRIAVADHVRGTVLSFVGSAKRLASIIGPALGGAAAHAASPRSAIAIFVPACGALSFVLHLCFLPIISSSVEQSINDVSLCTSYATVLRQHMRSLSLTAVFGLAMFWLRTARDLLLPLRALRLHLDARTLGGVVALGFVSDAGLALSVSGRIMDRHGRRPAGFMSCVGLSLGFLAAALSRDVIDLSIAALLLGAGNGLSSGLLMTVSTDLAPSQHRATFLSIFRFCSDCGVLLGAYLAGETCALTNTAVSCGLNALFAILTAIFVVTGLPETRPLSASAKKSQLNGVTAARLGDSTRPGDFSFRDDPELMASTAANPLRSSHSFSGGSSSVTGTTLFGTAAAAFTRTTNKQQHPATYSIIDPDADEDDGEPIFGGNNMLSTTTEVKFDSLDTFF
mmetsp:Transcript_1988/g.2631  ORF Transcript_1988/g.2631 Transcript_1988/m.2631 type:complete len:558 (-) Transcript_1988:375-2048(-)